MKNLIALISGVIILSATCCNRKDCHRSLFIVNNSKNAIYFQLSPLYSDTLILDSNPSSGGNEFKVEGASHKSDTYNGCVEGKFYYEDKIRYIIYDARTLETTPWDTVVKNYLILKRYDLTLQDLDSLNWTITYP
jgi:hypothetical protein